MLQGMYDRALLGALGGIIGWLLYGIFGDAAAAEDGAVWERALAGATLGGAIGYTIAAGPALLEGLWRRGARQAAYGLVGGAVGGALGFWVGSGPGWVVLGASVGISEGIAAGASRLLFRGGFGGAAAGALAILFVSLLLPNGDSAGWRQPLGLVFAGGCIAAGIAAAQNVFWPAHVVLLRGPDTRRRFPLFGRRNWLGSGPEAAVPLPGNARQALIERQADRYVLTNRAARPELVRLNGEPVSTPRDLKDGDRLQLSATELEFHARHSRARRAKDLEPPTLDAVAAHPFEGEPFAGVTTMHDLAARMQASPQAAVPLLESAAVARWCAENGWAYPVRAATAPGLAAVQQFFEALGLAKPPVVELEESQGQFTCIYPERLLCTALLRSPTRKWVFAEVTSGVAWLKVVTPQPAGVGQAIIEYEVDSGQFPAGGEQQGKLYITANFGQQLALTVSVKVHRPQEPFTRRVLRPLLTGALGGLLLRLLLAWPENISATGNAATAPAFWDVSPAAEQAYARRFVLACWWWGLPFIAYWCHRQQRPWREWAAYMLAGGGAGLAVSATAACLVPLLDTPPRVGWRLVAQSVGWSTPPPLWQALWLATAVCWWAILGAVLNLLARTPLRRRLK